MLIIIKGIQNFSNWNLNINLKKKKKDTVLKYGACIANTTDVI